MVLFLALVVVGSVVYATDSVLSFVGPVLEKTGVIKSDDIKKFSATTKDEIATVGVRGKEVSTHAQKVLGASVTVNENEESSLHNRAFEYGRYLYCQQVISEYEAKNK